MILSWTLWVLALGSGSGTPPSVIDRWFDGAAKETNQALTAWEDGDFSSAREDLDRAFEIEPEDPRAQFNAATGRLGAGDTDNALELLRESAAPKTELAADANYNIGNALLESGDLENAIAAYEEALRRNPDHGDSKHNLELALQQQQQQQQEQQQGEDGNQDEQQDEQEPSEQSESGDKGEPEEGSDSQPSEESKNSEGQPPEEQSEQSQSDQQQADPTRSEEEQSEQPGEPRGGEEQQAPQPPSRLPSFQDQEDMTAEQAAALLEAVENLERQNRAELAEVERAERAVQLGVEKDW
ncbi:MAG: tetratricopeptide repeat protein [Thermoanaerobaculia bacterium]|nr:tetratricopeptide repeat protein [Thermoanaerobaculia bacterium]